MYSARWHDPQALLEAGFCARQPTQPQLPPSRRWCPPPPVALVSHVAAEPCCAAAFVACSRGGSALSLKRDPAPPAPTLTSTSTTTTHHHLRPSPPQARQKHRRQTTTATTTMTMGWPTSTAVLTTAHRCRPCRHNIRRRHRLIRPQHLLPLDGEHPALQLPARLLRRGCLLLRPPVGGGSSLSCRLGRCRALLLRHHVVGRPASHFKESSASATINESAAEAKNAAIESAPVARQVFQVHLDIPERPSPSAKSPGTGRVASRPCRPVRVGVRVRPVSLLPRLLSLAPQTKSRTALSKQQVRLCLCGGC